MAGYGYSTYRISMISETVGGPVSKPFAPFVPSSQYNGNDPSEGYITKKKIVPVAGRPYSDDDESDDERKHRTSPIRGYGDYRGNKQPIGVTINKQDGYNNNGASYGKKEGTKSSSSGGAFKIDNHDGYNNGYGGSRPIEYTIRPTNKYDGTNYGYGGSNKEGRNPIGDSNYYDGTDYGGNKEGHNRIENPVTMGNYVGYGNPSKKDNCGAYEGYGKPVKKDNYDGYGGYGNPAKKDDYGAYGGYGKPVKKDDYDGYGGYGDSNNNGYGGYGIGNGNKKPFGSVSPTRGDDDDNKKKQCVPKPTPGWSNSPTKRNTPLSKATNDIDVAIGILKEEAANRGSNGGQHKPQEHEYGYEYDNNPHHQRRYDGPGTLSSRPVQPTTGKVDKKAMDLVNETKMLEKINVKDARAHQSRPSVPRGRVINHEEAVKIFKGMTI